MRARFREIDVFFRKKRFSEDELKDLKNLIRKKYPDKETRKAADGCINDHLLKYGISHSGRNDRDVLFKARSKREKRIDRMMEKYREDITHPPRLLIPRKRKAGGLNLTEEDEVSKKMAASSRRRSKNFKSKQMDKSIRKATRNLIRKTSKRRPSVSGRWGTISKAKRVGKIIYTRM